jgi:hypothetical protein
MHHRDASIENVAAHTEFTRALAEHGLLGLASLGFLGVMALRTLRARTSAEEKAFALSAWTFSCLFMLTAAMRVLTPAFLIGLTACFTQTHEPDAVRSGSPYFRHRPRRSAPAVASNQQAG